MRPNAIVTGGSRGIGKAISQRLQLDGFHVIIIDLEPPEMHLLEKSSYRFFPGDVSNEKDVESFFRFLEAELLTPHVLVNNAGIVKDNMIWKMPVQDFDQVLNVNLRAAWLMCRAWATIMREKQNGRIINIASRAWLGNPGQSNYSVAKAGLIALTRVLALELGRYDICVNAVAPGLIDTPMTRKLDTDVLEKLIRAQPGKKMGLPEHVAAAVSFLANASTQFINGQIVYVDGGKHIGAGI